MYRQRLALLLTISFGCVALSCGSKSANDDALTKDIQAKLSADSVTKPANVNVAVKDGVATLSGDVPSSDVELQAMKIANAETGVRSVNDQMKVNPALAANQLPNAGNAAPQTAPPSSQPAPAPADTASQPAPPPSSNTPAETSAPEPPKPVSVTIPAGTQVQVRMIDSIDTGKNTAGQVFQASLNAPLVAHDRVVVPAGAPATVLLESAKGAGRIKGSSEAQVRLIGIEVRGRKYDVSTTPYGEQGKGRGKQTAVRTGIGAAAGALIGGLAGGGKGAAIGSAVGGGAGFGLSAFTHGQQVKIPSETVLTFQLAAPLTIRR